MGLLKFSQRDPVHAVTANGKLCDGVRRFRRLCTLTCHPMQSPIAAARVHHTPSLALWLRRILWPQGLAADTLTWLNQSQCTAAWWSLVAFAALDVAHPIPLLHELWWCVLFVLWTIPWRGPSLNRSKFLSAMWKLSSLLFFSWSIYRTQIAVLASIDTWNVFDGIRWWELLSRPLQHTLASIVTAGVLVTPLQRVTRGDSAFYARLAAAPLSLILAVPTVFSVSRWAAHPTLCAIGLFDAIMPVLILSEAVSLLERRRRGISERSPSPAGVMYLAFMRGRLNAVAALVAFSMLVLLAIASGLMLWRLRGDHLHEAPFLAAGRAMAFPAVGFLAVLGAVASWRSLSRAGGRHAVLSNFATAGHILIAITSCVVILFGVLFAPRSANEFSEAIRNVGGSPWSISAPSSDTLKFTGELTNGAHDALENALANRANIRRLELDSPGGYVDEGLAVATVVEQHSLSTVVRRRCASACTAIFVVGKERVVESGGQLGFHRTRGTTWDFSPSENRDSDDRIVQQFKKHGLSDSFIRRALAVPSDQLWYPSAEELLAAGVTTVTAIQNPPPVASN